MSRPTLMNVTQTFASVVSSDYVRERIDPRRGESFYLHLSDLAYGLSRFRSDEPLRILDYGCGASPYRTLFPNSDYRRADAREAADLDYIVGDDQSVAERAEFFDLIVSTQVLEHVREASLYLSECHRLLRAGGHLILSTHGIYGEHGVPYDFRRWTGDGLKTELEQTGFEVLECYRMTTNARALAFLFEQHGDMLIRTRRSISGLALWILYSLLRRYRKTFHQWCDSTFGASRVVDSSEPGHILAIGLLCFCVKRADPVSATTIG